MLTFTNDYIEGAHPAILERLLATNFEKMPGYGEDFYSAQAKEKIRKACGREDLNIYFLVGGTQTNQVVIDSVLRPSEGVLSAETGHVNVHEAGAIEFTGHKVLPLPTHEGKIKAQDVKNYLETFYQDESHEHMVAPGMVYISYPTEYGTLYTKAELQALSEVCRAHQIPLYVDGARLGYGLMSPASDITLKDLAQLSDLFYIGGTKVGALCGEAVVFTPAYTPKHFVTLIKQHGALLAKGRLLGIQFDTLFTDELYFKISRHAIDMAEKLKQIFREKGYTFFLESPTNQQFILLENTQMQELKSQVAFSFWEALDEKYTVVRFATSWATQMQDLLALQKIL